jgi:hypothetical protein
MSLQIVRSMSKDTFYKAMMEAGWKRGMAWWRRGSLRSQGKESIAVVHRQNDKSLNEPEMVAKRENGSNLHKQR